MNVKAKRITTIAMLCALAYVVMAVGRVPVVLFLKYDPKDVVITLGGLIWGPMTACMSRFSSPFWRCSLSATRAFWAVS